MSINILNLTLALKTGLLLSSAVINSTEDFVCNTPGKKTEDYNEPSTSHLKLPAGDIFGLALDTILCTMEKHMYYSGST